MADQLLDDVDTLLRETAADVVLPLFRRLDAADVTEKAPGDLVTVADQRAEERISAELRRLLPGSLVVGEEAVAEDGSLLRHLRDGGDVWVVDPVDGTGNFAAGRRPFALMVALLSGGEPAASWVFDPLAGTMAVARAGDGTRLDGRPVRAGAAVAPERLRGTAMVQYLPQATRDRVAAGESRIGELLPGQHCAGREYLDLLTGDQQFVMFWRTLPWDHAPGALLVREAGGVARRFDGTEYHPADDGRGLLVAADEQTWHEVRAALLGD
ncbi:inositol monophosphatase family protein [Micromonospora matsumotoense]|uniref:Fructose-1,6-bisphosphatase n=1 Tax=Micromonospora matsumotoense TaxID=121616 RepID=A0A1C4WNK6_9ACTN|nr:inositol monophosphatase family protein [Micromonospora matsumotoense]SCE97481.1 fructose-1,6-bisphosphatase [Micromonospora matsumotoense]